MDLLTANSEYTDGLLNEERYQLGGASIGELYMLVYAQSLASHPLTWQVSFLNFKPKKSASIVVTTEIRLLIASFFPSF